MEKRSNRKWTIAIRPTRGAPPRKITKVLGLNGDGFSVLTPYHQERRGFLFKQLVEFPTIGKRIIKWQECIGFTAEDRVKLSYHVDGFAQFSSEKPGSIISGRDPTTGEPKGLGLFTRPLSAPIVSGPSVGITVWGIEEFQQATNGEDLIIFEPDDVYYRQSTEQTANCWHLAILAFAVGSVPPLRFNGKQALLQFALHPITAGVSGSVVELKALHLEAERVYLGLYVERWAGRWAAKSGWWMHGPGNYTVHQTGYVLQAVYPREAIPVEGRPALDRAQSLVPEEEPESFPGPPGAPRAK